MIMSPFSYKQSEPRIPNKPLPKLNKKAILTAIKADGALCDSDLVNGKVPGCGHVGRCALGAILFHHGMTNKELKLLPPDLSDIAPDPYNPWDENEFQNNYASTKILDRAAKKARRILIRLGMSADYVGEIMQSNDAFDLYSMKLDYEKENKTPENSLVVWKARAKHIIKFIKSL